MFVSHLFSFLFYLYVSASVQCKNHLARDKMRAFWRYPLCHGSTGKSGSCSGTLQNTVTVTTMSIEGRNAHLTPHTRHCALCWHVRLMGNDPLSNRIWVYGPQCAPLFRPAKIPVKAAENRSFQDSSKTMFIWRNSSKKNREKKKSSGILAGTGFGGPKNGFLKTGIGNLGSDMRNFVTIGRSWPLSKFLCWQIVTFPSFFYYLSAN